MKQHTPVLLYLLAIFFILAALIHLFGFIQTVQSWNWLRAVDYQPGPIYSVFKNIFLLLAFLCAAIFLLLRFTRAPLFDGIIVIINTVWFWFDRLILTQNPLPFKGHLFNLAATAVILFFFLFSLYLLQPYMKTAPTGTFGNSPKGEEDE